MTVVPFDPSRRRRRAVESEPGLSEAQARISLLERALIATLRENAQNWARAERAEGQLARYEATESETIAP